MNKQEQNARNLKAIDILFERTEKTPLYVFTKVDKDLCLWRIAPYNGDLATTLIKKDLTRFADLPKYKQDELIAKYQTKKIPYDSTFENDGTLLVSVKFKADRLNRLNMESHDGNLLLQQVIEDIKIFYPTHIPDRDLKVELLQRMEASANEVKLFKDTIKRLEKKMHKLTLNIIEESNKVNVIIDRDIEDNENPVIIERLSTIEGLVKVLDTTRAIRDYKYATMKQLRETFKLAEEGVK